MGYKTGQKFERVWAREEEERENKERSKKESDRYGNE